MIAIKDMEMPKSCALCERFEGACKYTDFGNYQTERNPSCPLVEIVTCKECRNYVKGALDEEICLKGHELIHENFYCADGERRE